MISMEHIIQQIAQELVEKIISRAYSGEISDIDTLTEEVLGDCKATATKVIEEILAEMNRQIRADKQMRKERGLVMKEKDRPRSLLTKLGTMHISRDYYYDKHREKHICILDEVTGIPAYDRITGGVSAEMVSPATEVSYAKSAQIATCGLVSRQSVRNKVLELEPLEKKMEHQAEKRNVKELHVFADEDHVHMQMLAKQFPKKTSSRDPLGWSREELGKLSKQRVYLKNNGKIKAADFKREREPETDTKTYREYARRLLSRSCEKRLDWSLFDRREPIFDTASGTQILIHKTARLHNTILS